MLERLDTNKRTIPKDFHWVVLTVVCLVGIVYFYSQRFRSQIKAHMAISKGYITEITGGAKGRRTLHYAYWIYENKFCEDTEGSPYDSDPREGTLIGKWFPVVYDSTDPGRSYLLITPENFADFNLPFPDSLNAEKP